MAMADSSEKFLCEDPAGTSQGYEDTRHIGLCESNPRTDSQMTRTSDRTSQPLLTDDKPQRAQNSEEWQYVLSTTMREEFAPAEGEPQVASAGDVQSHTPASGIDNAVPEEEDMHKVQAEESEESFNESDEQRKDLVRLERELAASMERSAKVKKGLSRNYDHVCR